MAGAARLSARKGESRMLIGRLKRLWKLAKPMVPGDADEVSEQVDELYRLFEEHTRDITNINTALQRIERKQNRWIEMLNLKSAMKEPALGDNGGEATDALRPASPLIPLMPGQIVD